MDAWGIFRLKAEATQRDCQDIQAEGNFLWMLGRIFRLKAEATQRDCQDIQAEGNFQWMLGRDLPPKGGSHSPGLPGHPS